MVVYDQVAQRVAQWAANLVACIFCYTDAQVSNRDTNGLVDQQNDAQSTQHKNSTVTRRVHREASLAKLRTHSAAGEGTQRCTVFTVVEKGGGRTAPGL